MPPRKGRPEGDNAATKPVAAAPRVKPPSIIDQALAYWNSIRAGREMPARTDFSPGDIPKLLPYVVLTKTITLPIT